MELVRKSLVEVLIFVPFAINVDRAGSSCIFLDSACDQLSNDTNFICDSQNVSYFVEYFEAAIMQRRYKRICSYHFYFRNVGKQVLSFFGCPVRRQACRRKYFENFYRFLYEIYVYILYLCAHTDRQAGLIFRNDACEKIIYDLFIY